MTDPVPDPDVPLAMAGDPQAFARIYRLHAPRVYTLASRMFDPAEAEVLTQDVFVRAWQKLATFRGESDFAAWLRRLALNLFVSRHRRLATERSRERSRGWSGEPDPAAATPTERGLRLDLERAIGRLPARARAVFVLHDVEGHSHEEIAALLQISAGTSKSQLHRARRLLCAELQEEP